ncbi:enoyl-CoA hydratase/isomerase family protein [Pseudonocardia dioxanivorans]|uniref:enoyl-CoA hydratase/isomerase family protein n=1 Tax=Pseudonocardia dioxanivorans TaxID=240495 RepID=UPI000301BC2F
MIVLEGAGRAFCSGADLDDPPGPAPVGGSPETRREAARFGERAVRAIREARPVTVARVHGHAIGGGLLPAAANDIRVAGAGRGRCARVDPSRDRGACPGGEASRARARRGRRDRRPRRRGRRTGQP